jgi:hypothetical protein
VRDGPTGTADAASIPGQGQPDENESDDSQRDEGDEAPAAGTDDTNVASDDRVASDAGGDGDAFEMDQKTTETLPDSCLEAPPGVDPFAGGQRDLEVEVGARDPETGIDFLPFGSGCGIPIGGVGQAGLTARLAVRVRGRDEPVQRAKVQVTLINYQDPDRDPAPSNGRDVVVTLNCQDDGWCYQVPLLVEISHLARLPELEGTLVTFEARVEQESTGLVGEQQGWGMFVLEEGDVLGDTDGGLP